MEKKVVYYIGCGCDIAPLIVFLSPKIDICDINLSNEVEKDKERASYLINATHLVYIDPFDDDPDDITKLNLSLTRFPDPDQFSHVRHEGNTIRTVRKWGSKTFEVVHGHVDNRNKDLMDWLDHKYSNHLTAVYLHNLREWTILGGAIPWLKQCKTLFVTCHHFEHETERYKAIRKLFKYANEHWKQLSKELKIFTSYKAIQMYDSYFRDGKPEPSKRRRLNYNLQHL